jgi:hypothetical protein
MRKPGRSPPALEFLFSFPDSLLISGDSRILADGGTPWARRRGHFPRKFLTLLEPEAGAGEGGESLPNYKCAGKARPRKWGDYMLAELADAVSQAI